LTSNDTMDVLPIANSIVSAESHSRSSPRRDMDDSEMAFNVPSSNVSTVCMSVCMYV